MTSVEEPRRDLGSIDLLSNVAMIANLTQDPETALVLATEQVCRHALWDVGHAFVVDANDNLRSTGVWNLEADLDLCTFGDDTLAIDFAHGQGLPGRVVATGRTAMIPDITEDPDFPRRVVAHASGLRSAFAFPVLAGPHVVAVLEFFSVEQRSAESHDSEVMSQIGIQLGRVFERAEAQADLERGASEVRQVLDGAGDAYVAMNSDGLITEWNRTAELTFGWSRNEVIGRTVSEVLVPTEFREAHNRGVERFLATETAHVLGEHLEMEALHKSGHEFPIDITMWSMRGRDGWSFYAFIRDISARRRAEKELDYEMLHDALTGLPNRSLLIERLEAALGVASANHAVSVFAVDVDRLRRINDSLGHDAGDELLATVANRILGVVRSTDTVSRVSGDEFLVLCEYEPDMLDLHDAARRIQEAISAPIRLGTDTTFVTATIGIATAELSGTNSETSEALIVAANSALAQAKQLGHGATAIFDSVMRQKAARRVQIESDLRGAVDRREFELHYQPLVSAKGTGVTGVEALVRWNHPRTGLVSPADFIPVAEETGIVIPLGQWVLEEACRQAQRWQRDQPEGPPLKIAVNLSGRQLVQANVVSMIARTLDRAALDSAKVRISLEITESTLMADPDNVQKVLAQIRALGVDLAIDDFGTGYSSLAYLKRFPVQTVKIDRSFIISVNDDPADRAIVRSIIELARALGMSVIAEGVETNEQFECLRDLGVDTIQGFLFSRPMTPADLVHTELWSARRSVLL